jgi:hypothetical protein
MLDEFLQRMDPERFPKRCYELVARIRDNVPLIAELFSDDETLVHSDAHFGNALFCADNALLID